MKHCAGAVSCDKPLLVEVTRRSSTVLSCEEHVGTVVARWLQRHPLALIEVKAL